LSIYINIVDNLPIIVFVYALPVFAPILTLQLVNAIIGIKMSNIISLFNTIYPGETAVIKKVFTIYE